MGAEDLDGGARVALVEGTGQPEDLLDGRYDFTAQFERGLEAILRGWN